MVFLIGIAISDGTTNKKVWNENVCVYKYLLVETLAHFHDLQYPKNILDTYRRRSNSNLSVKGLADIIYKGFVSLFLPDWSSPFAIDFISSSSNFKFYWIYGEIRETRVYISPVLLPDAVRLDPLYALAHRVFTFFHIWFSNQKFQYPLLISTR